MGVSRGRIVNLLNIQIEEEHKRKIEEIKSQMKCRKDFECCNNGFQQFCKVNLVAGGRLVECAPSNYEDSEAKQPDCQFALPFGYSTFFCTCPLRTYVAKKLGI